MSNSKMPFGKRFKHAIISRLSGQPLYQSISWEKLAGVVKAREKILLDVRSPSFALSLAGIYSEYAEARKDEDGNWVVYYR